MPYNVPTFAQVTEGVYNTSSAVIEGVNVRADPGVKVRQGAMRLSVTESAGGWLM